MAAFLVLPPGVVAQRSSVGCSASPPVPIFLPCYAFYSPCHDYNVSGALLPMMSSLSALLPGINMCDTSTWGPLFGRVVLISTQVSVQCTAHMRTIEVIMKNISDAGGASPTANTDAAHPANPEHPVHQLNAVGGVATGSSITYWPYPSSGYFALRRFSSIWVSELRFTYATPHVTIGSLQFETILIQRLMVCSGQNMSTIVTLLPEKNTHIELYEVIPVPFALSCCRRSHLGLLIAAGMGTSSIVAHILPVVCSSRIHCLRAPFRHPRLGDLPHCDAHVAHFG